MLADNFTKYVILRAYPSTEGKHDAVKFMDEFINEFGAPLRIITGRGSSLT